MARVMREREYISIRKRKYLIYTLISVFILAIIYVIGLYFNKGDRNNAFTAISAVFTLAVAKYAVQYISIIKYRDASEKNAQKLDKLPSEYNVFHSVLIGNTRGVIHFDHVVITDQAIYCVSEIEDEKYKKQSEWFSDQIRAKGIPRIERFVCTNQLDYEIKKDAIIKTEIVEEYAKILKQILI